MAETEIIQDRTRLKVFEELKSYRSPVHMVLLDGDYERVTHVTGIRTRRGEPYFRTELSQSFKAAVDGKKSWQIRVEFFGQDNIQYVFRTFGWKIARDGIWHKFPEIIERRQRRKYFRLELPLQTKLVLTVGAGHYKMTAIDISIGGIHGELAVFAGSGQDDPPWAVGDTVKGLMLEAEMDQASVRIRIDEGTVRRCNKEISDKKYQYAFEFTGMEKSQETALVDLVYELQRKILKERININA